jgi:hypothetical protein
MGPLPEGDRQDTLQQLSLKALRACLPERKFLFRDERVDDKGVDGALEVKFEYTATNACSGKEEVRCRFTNCRAQVQLKSTDAPVTLQDGTVSLAVDTGDLNYLLYGQCPLYLLWIAPTNEFRYAWARMEWGRLNAENPEWMAQGTIALHFHDVLTQAALDEIQDRIVQEARLERNIYESLARSSLSERVVVAIEPKTLRSTDPQQIFEWLTSAGMTIVSAGFGSQVMEWMGLLNPAARQEARVQLAAAYAQTSLGRYFEAMGHLAAAAIRRADLSPVDQQFLNYLRHACEYHTGRIDLQEYLRREREWSETQTGAAAAQHRLEVLRQERLGNRDQRRRAGLQLVRGGGVTGCLDFRTQRPHLRQHFSPVPVVRLRLR